MSDPSPLTDSVRISHLHVGVEPAEKHISVCRALTGEGECDSRRGVQVSEGQMRLDVEPSGFRPNTGSMRDRPVRLPADPATSEILHSLARPPLSH